MYLIGASGHGKVVAEIAEENKIYIKGFIDCDLSITKILDYKVISNSIDNLVGEAIVSIGDNFIRKNIVLQSENFFLKNYVLS
nr:hypothetical protein [Myroides injenensis]